MKFTIDENIIFGMADDIIDAGLEAVGVLLEGEAIANVPIDTSFLKGQISREVNKAEKKVLVIANTEYAAMQEFGGDIRPSNAKALTVPIHKDAKGKRASDFTDLVLIKSKKGKSLLVKIIGKGKNQKIQPMFVLVNKVTIPARPYLGPALYNNLDRITEIFASAAGRN